MATVRNPILPGFNPDPSICRVGEDYYIATSTFEWFPGVQVHHSRDLVHWRLLTHPLGRLSQLDLRGCPHSAGVWAPCLSHDGERFWLIYTNTRHWGRHWWDSPNFAVHASEITGPWSEPVFLNCSGFDPSMFHDEDGRKWLVNMRLDNRPGRDKFSGIELQEFYPEAGQMVGPVHLIWKGTERGVTEGPHLYRRDGYYYLLCAEGGTGHGHCVSVARSHSIEGPYETHPDNPILHAPKEEDPALYKTGHASFVEAGDGSWWMAHLCGRPIPSFVPGDDAIGNRYCPLGRESALQRLEWPEGEWPRMAGGEPRPRLTWEGPDLPDHPWPERDPVDVFDDNSLPEHYQSLREPMARDWCDLDSRPGWLRLRGRCNLDGQLGQSLVARRIRHIAFHAHTRVDVQPRDWKQRAGLVVYYNRTAYRYLAVTADDDGRRILVLESVDPADEPGYQRDDDVVPLPEDGPVELAADSDADGRLTFSWRVPDGQWQRIGAEHALARISDEHAREGSFTGAFVGMASTDQRDYNVHADFRLFAYQAASG
jgi:xylan 1,4-beta-xylosidase